MSNQTEITPEKFESMERRLELCEQYMIQESTKLYERWLDYIQSYDKEHQAMLGVWAEEYNKAARADGRSEIKLPTGLTTH